MAAADLQSLFNPRSIAVIGASADPVAISGRPLRLLVQHGYGGALYPVNPKYEELYGRPAYPSIGQVPDAVDLAIVVVRAARVPELLAECAAAGVRHAIVISSGFAEIGPDGRGLEDEIRRRLAGSSLRVCGPNCEGIYNVAAGIPAGFSPAIDPDRGFAGGRPGPIAIVAQSGGLGFALFNRGMELGLGFSAVVTTGNEVDLEWLDYVEYLVDDPNTRVILGFVESLKHGRRLVDVARAAAERGKPLVVAKVGRSEVGRQAAVLHTGSLVGSDEAYEAAFRQLGVIRVEDVDEMLDAAAYFSVGRLPAGRRVAILTASGGAGVWLADACAARGLELPAVDDETQAEIASFVPAYGSTANPVDVTAQVTSHGGVERALDLLARSDRFDAVAVITSLVADHNFRTFLPDLRRTVASTDKSLVYFSYTTPTPASLETLRELGIPCYTSPVRTARALATACRYRAFLDRRHEIALFGAYGGGRSSDGEAIPPVATEAEVRTLLAPCRIPSPPEGLARSADEAVAIFRQVGGPVALKVQSPVLAHKTDVGGVRLNLATEADVRTAYDEILAAVRSHRPDAHVRGVLVQQMVADGVEGILGARVDPDFGPLVLFGLGGIHVEVLRDVALRLAPVSAAEARAMVEEIRGAPLLHGARGRPPADVAALVDAIAHFSAFVAELPAHITAVEINPLLVLPRGRGVVMVDAAIELDGPTTDDRRPTTDDSQSVVGRPSSVVRP